MSEREREKMRESMKGGERERVDASGKLRLWDDTSAEERYYARSVKIRMATLELLKELADRTDEGKPVPWETFQDLARTCGQYVKKGKWDRKPGSSVACERWVGQYCAKLLGFFRLSPYGDGFVVAWRDRDQVVEVQAMLAPYAKRRGEVKKW